MSESNVRMTQQLAAAASAHQEQMSGRSPRTVTSALSEDTLVLTLHDALTPAEKVLAQRPEGAAKVEEFHKQLFSTSTATMREEIRRVTGREVQESALELVSDAGAVVHTFQSGTLVQVYLLSQPTSTSTQTEKTAVERTANNGTVLTPRDNEPT